MATHQAKMLSPLEPGVLNNMTTVLFLPQESAVQLLSFELAGQTEASFINLLVRTSL